ncbi:MAG: extracellular solute-binding protein [Oscillospiraceae bacterium]|jgi:raffinose/stachyose/melibiose transport system substrate-binding protein|nr:extracellular solute-binding protein [Oscillospiraceae bacterium]
MKGFTKITAVSLSAAMTLSMAGCAGGGASTTSAAGSTTADSSKAVSLELFSTKTENASTLKELIAAFHAKHPNITITLSSPQDAGTVLKTRLTKDNIPDIIAMGGDSTYTEVQSAGVLEDLSSESYVSGIQNAYKKMVYDVQQDKEQKLYGIPYATNASGVLYNEDLFKSKGLFVPKTWDEFIALCKKLQSGGTTPFELTFKDSWCTLPAWNSLAPDLQPANFTDDRKNGKTTFAATHKEIAQKYLDLLPFAQKDYMGTTYADGNTAFAQGKAAMMINGNWAIPEFKKVNSSFKVNMFAFPSSNDSSKNYVTSGVDVLLAVSSKSANKEAAKEFVSFMMQKENAQKYITEQFAFSAINGVEQNDKTVAGVKEDIASGKVANYPDHYYPSGFDLASLAQNFGKNAAAGMAADKNIADFLKQCDTKYDAANVSD